MTISRNPKRKNTTEAGFLMNIALLFVFLLTFYQEQNAEQKKEKAIKKA